jgi:hypothetical protein
LRLWRRNILRLYPHFDSPQFKHVKQPSICIMALVWHFMQSRAPGGKLESSAALPAPAFFASYSRRFSSINFN